MAAVCLVLSCGLLAACDLPKDPEGTLDSLRGETLRVGAMLPAATLRASDEFGEVRRLAERLDAKLELVEGNPHDLVARLERGDIQLLAGGIPDTTPFKSRIGLTKPVGRIEIGGERTDSVLGIRKGENAFLMFINRGLARSDGQSETPS